MTSPSLPDNWRALLAGYVLDDLDASEMALVEQWLDQYPEAAAELEALQTTWDRLPDSLPLQGPPPLVRDRVLAAVTPALPTATPSIQRRLPWQSLALGLGWAATAVTAAIALLLWQENQQLRLALRQNEGLVASFTQPTSRLYTLTGTEVAPQARGQLAINPTDQTAQVITANLPSLTTDEIYRLWAVAEGEPVFCGQFNPQADGVSSQWVLPDAACGADDVAMLITAERATDPFVPAGDLVLQSQS